MAVVAPTMLLTTDFLSLMSPVNRRRLLEGSTRAVYPAGSIATRRGGRQLHSCSNKASLAPTGIFPMGGRRLSHSFTRTS